MQIALQEQVGPWSGVIPAAFHLRRRCGDCGEDITADSSLVLTDDAWRQALRGGPLKRLSPYLCAHCLIVRMGRKLFPADLIPGHPWNITWWHAEEQDDLMELRYRAWVLYFNDLYFINPAQPDSGGIPCDPGINVTQFVPPPANPFWCHVTRHELEDGQKMWAQKGDKKGYNPTISPWRANWIWMVPSIETSLEIAALADDTRIYLIEPESPQPWNGLGKEGWVCKSARMVREVTEAQGLAFACLYS